MRQMSLSAFMPRRVVNQFEDVLPARSIKMPSRSSMDTSAPSRISPTVASAARIAEVPLNSSSLSKWQEPDNNRVNAPHEPEHNESTYNNCPEGPRSVACHLHEDKQFRDPPSQWHSP